MAVLAHLDAPRRALDRRRTARRTLSLEVDGRHDVGSAAVVILDLSVTGLLLETSAELNIGDEIDVVIPHAGATTGSIIWRSGAFFGCEFRKPITAAAVSAALLQSPPVAPDAALAVRQAIAVEGAPLSSADQLSARQRVFVIVGLALAGWTIIAAILLALL
jgi:PilZ domain